MTKHRERVMIRNILKHGAAGVNALAFQHQSINETTRQYKLVCTSPANTAQNLPKDLKEKRSQDLPMEGAAGDAHPSTLAPHPAPASVKRFPLRRTRFCTHKKHAGDSLGFKLVRMFESKQQLNSNPAQESRLTNPRVPSSHPRGGTEETPQPGQPTANGCIPTWKAWVWFPVWVCLSLG